MKLFYLLLSIILLQGNCTEPSENIPKHQSIVYQDKEVSQISNKPLAPTFDTTTRTIHILVALCDNTYQGIVPVPAKIGNGQDPKNNLYWGTAYGIKSYFKKSKEWKLLDLRKSNNVILERAIFKHKTKNYYVVADAYDGKYIKQTTEDFLKSCYGMMKDTVNIADVTLGIAGNSKLLGYIGHDGLMDFDIKTSFKKADDLERDIIVLACISKDYFAPYLAKANVNPLVWTTNLMAPEAYTIHDALSGYVMEESNDQIRLRAAKAYAKYQKCGLMGAKRLLVTGK